MKKRKRNVNTLKKEKKKNPQFLTEASEINSSKMEIVESTEMNSLDSKARDTDENNSSTLSSPNIKISQLIQISPQSKGNEKINNQEKAWHLFDFLLNNLNLHSQIPAKHPQGWKKEFPLYPYQLKSLGKMLQMEMNPDQYLDPSWEFIENESKYRNLLTGDYVKYPSFIQVPKGGILCEDMGCGKTAICLALILSTKGTVAKPPLGESIKYYEESLYCTTNNIYQPLPLVELAARQVKMNSYSKSLLPLELQDYLDKIPQPFYYEDVLLSTSNRTERIINKVFLSNTTLLVVPPTLIDQWLGEIKKFIHKDQLKVLVIRSFSEWTKFNAEQLCAFDLILTSQNTLRAEHQTGYRTSGSKKEKPLQCELYGCSPDCSCSVGLFSYNTPIFSIRWLRLIIDEGHILGHSSVQTMNSSKLSSERKWCISGTPIPMDVLSKELNNLRRLTNFLQVNPFDNDKFWTLYIQKPILKDQLEGKQRLKNFFNLIMVRNSDEDIYSDVKLPKCHVSIVKLKFKPHELARYNELLALIRINLLSSKCVGVDSLMSSENLSYAIEALNNLRRTCFHIDPMTVDQRKLALQAIRDAEEAHKIGKEIQTSESLKELDYIWNLLNIPTPDLVKNPFAKCSGCSHWTSKEITLPVSFINFLEESHSPSNEDDGSITSREIFDSLSKENNFIEGESQPKKRKLIAPTKLDKLTEEHFSMVRSKKKDLNLQKYDSEHRITSICSTKLDYLISQLEKITPYEKVIIFTSLTDTLGFVLDALDNSGIKFVEFHTKMNSLKRSAVIQEFNTIPSIRVILMKTELAAFGINLTAATRIFILEPAWSINIEKQAIKRAHRIGQTKEVFVEKIIMDSSVEEIMYNLLASTSFEGSQIEIQERKTQSLLSSLQLLSSAISSPYLETNSCFWLNPWKNFQEVLEKNSFQVQSWKNVPYFHAWCPAKFIRFINGREIQVEFDKRLKLHNRVEIISLSQVRCVAEIKVLTQEEVFDLPLLSCVEVEDSSNGIQLWKEGILFEKNPEKQSIKVLYKNKLFNNKFNGKMELKFGTENKFKVALPFSPTPPTLKELNKLIIFIHKADLTSESNMNDLKNLIQELTPF